jgi:hypothetical protein
MNEKIDKLKKEQEQIISKCMPKFKALLEIDLEYLKKTINNDKAMLEESI